MSFPGVPMLRQVTAAPSDEWWKTLTPTQQKKYIKEHPNSKYAKNGDMSPDPTDAPTEKKGIVQWIKDKVHKWADNPDILKSRLNGKAKQYDKELSKKRDELRDVREQILENQRTLNAAKKSNKRGTKMTQIKKLESDQQALFQHASTLLDEIRQLRGSKQLYLNHVNKVLKAVT